MSPLPQALSFAEGADDAEPKGLLGPTGMAAAQAKGRLPTAPTASLLRGEESQDPPQTWGWKRCRQRSGMLRCKMTESATFRSAA